MAPVNKPIVKKPHHSKTLKSSEKSETSTTKKKRKRSETVSNGGNSGNAASKGTSRPEKRRKKPRRVPYVTLKSDISRLAESSFGATDINTFIQDNHSQLVGSNTSSIDPSFRSPLARNEGGGQQSEVARNDAAIDFGGFRKKFMMSMQHKEGGAAQVASSANRDKNIAQSSERNSSVSDVITNTTDERDQNPTSDDLALTTNQISSSVNSAVTSPTREVSRPLPVSEMSLFGSISCSSMWDESNVTSASLHADVTDTQIERQNRDVLSSDMLRKDVESEAAKRKNVNPDPPSNQSSTKARSDHSQMKQSSTKARSDHSQMKQSSTKARSDHSQVKQKQASSRHKSKHKTDGRKEVVASESVAQTRAPINTLDALFKNIANVK